MYLLYFPQTLLFYLFIYFINTKFKYFSVTKIEILEKLTKGVDSKEICFSDEDDSISKIKKYS